MLPKSQRKIHLCIPLFLVPVSDGGDSYALSRFSFGKYASARTSSWLWQSRTRGRFRYESRATCLASLTKRYWESLHQKQNDMVMCSSLGDSDYSSEFQILHGRTENGAEECVWFIDKTLPMQNLHRRRWCCISAIQCGNWRSVLSRFILIHILKPILIGVLGWCWLLFGQPIVRLTFCLLDKVPCRYLIHGLLILV